MFYELFVEATKKDINNLYDTMKLIMEMGYFKIGRKKIDKWQYTSTRRSKGKTVGIEANKLFGTPIKEDLLTKDMFVFTGDPLDQSKFETLVDSLVDDPDLRLSWGRKNSWNSSTGKYNIMIINKALETQYHDADPDTIWQRWYSNTYNTNQPIKLNSYSKDGVWFSYFGTTSRPDGIYDFMADWKVETTDSTYGDGIGDWYGKMTDKKMVKKFLDLLEEIGYIQN